VPGRLSPAERLAAALRAELAAAADTSRAPGMQAYMKSAMPYLGVTSPVQETIYRRVIPEHPLPDSGSWQAAVLRLWDEAGHREERYAALAVLGHPLYAAHRTPGALALYERLIVDGAWWDLVDGIATRRLRELLAAHPDLMSREMRAWSRDPHLWKRRSAIICQVGRKRATDLELLYDCIEPNLADRDFFICKAIGWALRDYAWADPDEIVRYVSSRQSRLSGLSRREALKNVSKLQARKA
jgi:3-methyladenine DNA glycosylase AlkD